MKWISLILVFCALALGQFKTEKQRDVDKSTHQPGFFRRLCREDALHIKIGRRAGHGDEQTFEHHHHKHDGEQRIAVLINFIIGDVEDTCPIQFKLPTEKDICPSVRNNLGKHVRRDSVHRNNADSD